MSAKLMLMEITLFQKNFLVSSVLPKNKQKHFEPRYQNAVKSKFFVRFLEELKTPESPFEINCPSLW